MDAVTGLFIFGEPEALIVESEARRQFLRSLARMIRRIFGNLGCDDGNVLR